MKALARFIATGGYSGYAPVAPGTFGTLPAIPLAWLLARAAELDPLAYSAGLIASIAVAVWAAGAFASEQGIKDPQTVVVDEIVGYFVTVAFLPADPWVLGAGFFAFRFFDIVKPPPARQAERLPGGVGIVADDLIAGVFANVLVRVARFAGLL
jgi:phosphatidylglycerophosphatase A